jgi:hypothetical protein
MTSMTPAVAKIRLESALWDGSSEKFTLRSQVENFLLLLGGLGKT